MPPEMVQFANAVLVVTSTNEQVTPSIPVYSPTPEQLPENPFSEDGEFHTVDASQAIKDAHDAEQPDLGLDIADKNQKTLEQARLDAQAEERANAEAEEAKRQALLASEAAPVGSSAPSSAYPAASDNSPSADGSAPSNDVAKSVIKDENGKVLSVDIAPELKVADARVADAKAADNKAAEELSKPADLPSGTAVTEDEAKAEVKDEAKAEVKEEVKAEETPAKTTKASTVKK